MVPIGKKPAPSDHESSLKIFLARCPYALKQWHLYKGAFTKAFLLFRFYDGLFLVKQVRLFLLKTNALLTLFYYTLNDLFDLQDDLGPFESRPPLSKI